MELLARWNFRHRRLVVALWIVGIAAIWGLGQLVPAHFSGGSSLPNTDSRAAADLMRREFPDQSGEVDTIVWTVTSGTVRDAAVRERIQQMLSSVADLPHVTSVQGAYDVGGDRAINADGRVAFATVTFDTDGDELPKEAAERVIDVARSFATPQVAIDLGGYAIGQATMTIDTSISELVAVLAAAMVLLFAFGSLLGMSLPLVSALASLVPAVALIGLVSRALTTAGRSVVFAGTIVCLALLGLLSLGVGYLSGMAASAAIGIAFTMIAALTLLPAMLAFFGTRVFSRRERRLASAHRLTVADGRGWVRWAGLIQRRPAMFAALATLIIVVLALPVVSLRLGSSDQGNDPTSRTTRRAYDALAKGFGPGFNAPLFVVVSTPTGHDQASAQRIATEISGTPGVAAVTPTQVSPSGRIAVLQAFPTTSPQSQATDDLLHRLRDTVIPRATSGTGLTVLIGGFTATTVDFTDTINSRLPLFIGIIVLLGAVLPRDNRRAVTTGQIETGRVITAAGAIMVLVFLSFTAGERLMKLFGIGLGITVLLDAFVIRTMLVPALLHLFGQASWWLPGWLNRRLPTLSPTQFHAGTDHQTRRTDAQPPADQAPTNARVANRAAGTDS